MPYIAATEADRAAMLERIGVGSVEELFSDIPAAFRFPGLDLPAPISELEATRELEALAAKNLTASSTAWFLGAGAYYHFIPAVVGALALARGIPHRLHSLPARGLAGHTAGHLRVPEHGSLPPRGRRGQRLALRRGHGPRRGGADGVQRVRRAASGPGRVRAILCADMHPEYKGRYTILCLGLPHPPRGGRPAAREGGGPSRPMPPPSASSRPIPPSRAR